MASPRRAQYRAELGRLPGIQRNATPDHHQLAAAVPAGDHDLGLVDRAEDPADDHFLSGAVLHLSLGSPAASRIVVLRVLISTCATPMSGGRAAWVDSKQAA